MPEFSPLFKDLSG